MILTVLKNKQVFLGSSQIFNRAFFTAYIPLLSEDKNVQGMLFVGKPQTELFKTAKRSVQLTFIGSVILMLISLIPAYIISRYIKQNLKA